MNEITSKVGSKGELFPPSKLRKILGLEPGMRVIFFIKNHRLIVEPIPNIVTLLKSKRPLKTITTEELKANRKELSKAAENYESFTD